MDAAKFIEERNRMCKSYNDECDNCPAFCSCGDKQYCAVNQESTVDVKVQIAIVEKWSIENPYKTMQSVFLEQWPEAQVEDDGVLALCPSTISSAYRNKYGGCANYGVNCSDCCRKFWMQKVE